ncbi:hypothetical protein Tco_1204919, partial [Tanacetum coccineum]
LTRHKLSAIQILLNFKLVTSFWRFEEVMSSHMSTNYPDEQMISLGIGDITKPIPEVNTSAMATHDREHWPNRLLRVTLCRNAKEKMYVKIFTSPIG